MNKPSYVVDQILRTRKITEYLASKGHHPIGNEMNGKLKYKCPLHGENTPSFIVFVNGEFENFFCFGCKASYHIVHLYRDLEGISTRDAIKALSNGLDLDLDAQLNYVIREVEGDKRLAPEANVADLALVVGRILFDFVDRVDSNTEDTDAAERMFQLIDTCIETNDVPNLQKIYDLLPDTLMARIKLFEDRKEQRILMATR